MAIAVPQPRVLADVVDRTWAKQAALVLGATGFVAASAQIAFFLPWNPAVPITLQTFAVVLSAAALGSTRGVLAMLLYAMLGSLGLPVFTMGKSGFGGATFGYVIGFIVAAYIVGKVAELGVTRTVWRTAGLMLLGNVVIYAIGVTWLQTSTGLPWFGPESAFAFGARDFIVGDLIKIAAASGLLPLAWKLLDRANLR